MHLDLLKTICQSNLNYAKTYATTRETLAMDINISQGQIPNNTFPRTSRAFGLSFSSKWLCFLNKQMLTEHHEISTRKCYKSLFIKPLKVFNFLKCSSLRLKRWLGFLLWHRARISWGKMETNVSISDFIYATVIMFLKSSKEVTAVYKPFSKKSLKKKKKKPKTFSPLLLPMLLSWQW